MRVRIDLRSLQWEVFAPGLVAEQRHARNTKRGTRRSD